MNTFLKVCVFGSLLLPLGAACATQNVAQAATTPPSNFKSVTAVLPVKDQAAAIAWSERWIGRAPDLVPVEGVAEWQLAGQGWLQVALDPDHAGSTSVVVVVRDVLAQHKTCLDAGVTPADIQDFGIVKLFEIVDPDGNKVVFVQETGAG